MTNTDRKPPLVVTAKSRLCADHFNYHQFLTVYGSNTRLKRVVVDKSYLYYVEEYSLGHMIHSQSFRSFAKLLKTI